MRVTPTDIPDVLILEPKVFEDKRGFFMESFNQRVFDESVGRHVVFVQDNHSRSTKGVLRGLHYQLPPHAQGKLVRVIAGAVFDVAVDLRRSSPSFGHWVGVEPSRENRCQLWIPAGFAHGFVVLSESADVLYKTTDYYAAQAEVSMAWDDPALAITWPGLKPFTLSKKDADGLVFESAPLFD